MAMNGKIIPRVKIVRMDLEEIGITAGNRVVSVHDRDYCRAHVNAALNPRVP